MLKHFGVFFVGVLIGVLIISLAVVGGGYMLLTQSGSMKKVEETVGPSVGMDLDEEQENLSILEYGKGVLEIFNNLSTTPIKDIEATVGIKKISNTLSDAVGIEASVIAESSLSDLGATLTKNLTLTVMRDKFEVSLPDIPLFKDEEFLSKPVSDAFGDLDSHNLDGFIEVVYDNEATEEKPASSKFLQELGKKSLKEVSEDMDGIIQDTVIGDIIKIDENSSNVLIYIKDTKIRELDSAIKEMKIGDAVSIKEDSHAIMKAIADLTLEEMGNGEILQSKIDGLTLGDVVKVSENSATILKALQYTEIGGLSEKMNNLTLGEVMDNPDRGILAIIGSDTKVQDIGPAFNDAIAETSLYALRAAGVFNYNLPHSYTFEGLINRINKNNSNPKQIVEDFTSGTASSNYLKSITSSLYIYKGEISNSVYQGVVSGLPGYKGEYDISALEIGVDEANGAYVFTPEVVKAILEANDLSSSNNVTFFVDDGIDIEIQAPEIENEDTEEETENETVYENYDKLFSIMYDLSSEENSGTLYLGTGLRSETNVGGCMVYAASGIKVKNAEGEYVDYVQGEELPIKLKRIKKEVKNEEGETEVMSEYNTWVSAYTEYEA